MRVCIITYGCQMNERDSEAVAALLSAHGHVLVDNEAEADAILVNTCTVRGKAEDKALGKLGLLTATKREHPGRLVGAMGCMVQRLKGDIFKKVRGLDFALGTRHLSRLPELLNEAQGGREPVLDLIDIDQSRDDTDGAFSKLIVSALGDELLAEFQRHIVILLSCG